MEIQYVLLFLMGLLLVAVLVEPLAQKIRLPFTAALVIAGFVGSEALVAAGFDTGIRAENFHDLIFYVFIPVLVFESAFHLDASLLLRNLLPVLFFAIPLMLLSAVTAGALIYYGIAHPQGFPWIAALLTGALLAATDPVAVVALFRSVGAPERLAVLLEGESLFNDATAIVVFGLFLALALAPGQAVDPGKISLQFLLVFCGGIVVGVTVGLACAALLKGFRQPILQSLVTLICAYSAYIVAEELFHVSGVMAVLAAGLVLGKAVRNQTDNRGFVDQLWEFNAYLANALVFLLMGLTITVDMFTERWLAMLIGILAVLAARAVGIFGFVPLISWVSRSNPIPARYQPVMFWGGLRGAVTLALALAIPVELDYWWTIQSIAFGVVIFTLFIQAPTMKPLLLRLGLTGGSPNSTCR